MWLVIGFIIGMIFKSMINGGFCYTHARDIIIGSCTLGIILMFVSPIIDLIEYIKERGNNNE